MSTAQKTEPKSSKVGIIIVSIFVGIGILILIPIILLFIIGFIGAIASGGDDTIDTGNANVAHLSVSGTILTETSDSIFSASGDTSSEKFVKTLEKIKKDKSIKAVLIEINSPGGSGVASDEIAQAINDLDIPTVSYIREVGASGSYWVASSTDYIFANRFSTIGSIGVIASYLDFSEFIEEYNVSYQRFVAGENKDFGSPFRKVTPDQSERFQSILNQLHTIFIAEVASGRNASIEDITAIADGSIFTADEALANGLIDEIGTKQDAVAHLEKILGQKVILTPYVTQPSFLEALAGVTSQGFYSIGLGIGEKITTQNKVSPSNPLIIA